MRRAILCSGGLDSAVLVASELEETRGLYGEEILYPTDLCQ